MSRLGVPMCTSRGRRLRSALVIAAWLALVPSQLLAQNTAPAETSEAQRETARQHFRRGVELIRTSQWSAAVVELEAAREVRATPAVHYNLGLAYRAVGRLREASLAFFEYLRAAPAGADETLLAQASQYQREARSSLARLELSVEPANARVFVDGRPSTITGPIELDPGRHVVEIEHADFATDRRTIDLQPSSVTVSIVRMVPRNEVAYLRVVTNLSDALIRVDGSPVGNGVAEENIRAGRHVVDVSAANHTTFAREVFALPNSRNTVNAVLRDRRTVFERPWFWAVTGGVVAAGILTTILLWPAPAPLQGTLGTEDYRMGAGLR